MPPIAIFALGAVGATVVAKFIAREWRRVNAELDRLRTAPAAEMELGRLPKLRRDPATGVYRPHR
jgi:hypothetical protein